MLRITTISRLLASSIVMLLALTACSTMPGQPKPTITATAKDGPPPFPVDVSQLKDASPRYEPKAVYGNPSVYTINEKRYYVMDSAKGYSKVGVASWYGTKFHGKATSSREPYDMLAMTAASPTLPIPTYVRVTNLENGKQVVVKVNDRGPFANERIMDLSYAAAKKLGYAEKGTAKVKVEAITFDSPDTMLAKNNANIKKATNGKAKSTGLFAQNIDRITQNNVGAAKPAGEVTYLQVGAFRQIEKAQQVKIKVAQLTHQSARIETATLHDKPLYRVQIGPLRALEKADLISQLQHQGFVKTITVVS